MRPRRLVAVAVVFACACDPFPSYDGFTGGLKPTSEAGAASGDAQAGKGDAGGGLFCDDAGAHAFCADFDHGADPLLGWSFFRDQNHASSSYALDSSLSKTAPSSARLRVSAGAPFCSFAELMKDFAGSYGAATLELDLWLGDGGNGKFPDVGVGYVTIARNCGVVLFPSSGNPVLFQQDDPNGTSVKSLALSRGLPVGRWSHVRIDYDVTGTAAFVRVAFDGESVLTVPTVPSNCVGPGDVEVGIGPHCSRSIAADVRVDDVVVDLR
jgi:hypothetical protein